MRVVSVFWCPIHPVDTAGAVRARELYPRLVRWEARIAAPGPPPPQRDCVTLPRHALSRLPWPWSPQVFNLWGRAPAALVEALREWKPDAVVAEGPWAAHAARRLADACRVPLAVVVLCIEHRATIGAGRGPARRALARAMEKRAYRLADALICMTEPDRVYLAERMALGDRSISVVPQGADLERLAPRGPDLRGAWGIRPGERVVLFFGKLDYPPNADALRWLASEIAPHVRTRVPTARFVVAGSRPPRRSMPPLEFVGFVPDLAAALRTADVCVAPLRAGTGIRTKVLEGLAAGRPTVATSVGDLGIGTEDGVHLLRRNGGAAFADAVADLLEDPAAAAALGAAGRQHVARRYDWRAVAARFEEALDGIVSCARPASWRCSRGWRASGGRRSP